MNEHQFLFVPSNDTHVQWMNLIAQVLANTHMMVFPDNREGATDALKLLRVPYSIRQLGSLSSFTSSVIVLGNDWGPLERGVINEAKSLGIPTVCIQEGCLDFADQDLGRMKNADYAFLQGPEMRKYFQRETNVFVTGNPKYDDLHIMPLPDKPMVMINVNFTYGIDEEHRDQWVCDAIAACKELDLEFFLSQHPRDASLFPAEYRLVKSSAFKLKAQMKQASILISRFSTVIYEMLRSGREVIYYNPHNEPFGIFAQDTTGGIKIANHRVALTESLRQAVNDLGISTRAKEKFLLQHCNTLNHDAAETCASALLEVAAVSGASSPKSQQPLVSVIIPTYNRPDIVILAIKSVLEQTYRNFEIIVINDAGTNVADNIFALNQNNNIVYIEHAVNKGLGATRNTGLKAARGKYIAYLDDDDLYLPHHLETLVTFLESHPACQVAYTDAYCVHQKLVNGAQVISKDVPYSFDFDPDRILVRNMFPVLCVMHKKSCLDKVGLVDESLAVHEDWELWIRMSREYLFTHIKEVTCEYTVKEGGTSMTDRLQPELLSTMKIIYTKYKDCARLIPGILEAQKLFLKYLEERLDNKLSQVERRKR